MQLEMFNGGSQLFFDLFVALSNHVDDITSARSVVLPIFCATCPVTDSSACPATRLAVIVHLAAAVVSSRLCLSSSPYLPALLPASFRLTFVTGQSFAALDNTINKKMHLLPCTPFTFLFND